MIIPTSLDYTDKDRASLAARLHALISSVFPTWTSDEVADFGEMLLELFSFIGGVLTFYQDGQARESKLITATQRKNIIALAKQLGYTPRGATAAQAQILVTLPAVPVDTLTIPAGTRIPTADITTPIYFRLLSDAVIPALTNPPQVTVTAENSDTQTDTFTSNGLPDQSFELSRSPFVDQSSVVTAANGSYTLVDNFLDSVGTDRHYVIVVDQNDVATITFGDGVNGAIPSSPIDVQYSYGGGSAGNVDPNTITRLSGSFPSHDSGGNLLVPSVTNPAKAEGGAPRESNAQIKDNAPAQLRAETRCVAREDFEINAKRVVGVARALMLTSNEDPAVAENRGDLYIVPVGGEAGVAPSSTLLSQVLTMVTVTFPCTLTFKPTARAAVYFPVNVYARVFKKPGFVPAQVGLNIRATLKNFFALTVNDQGVADPNGSINPKVDFGAHYVDTNGNPAPAFNLADLFDAIDTTAGVRKIGGLPSDFLLNNAHNDVTIPAKAFPILGSVTLIDADTGNPI